MKECVKKILKSSFLGRGIYPCVQWCYRLVAIPIKRHRLQKNGVVMLKKIHDVLNNNNIDYYVDFGTLLGVIREHDFIKHDDDIDLTIICTEVDPRQILRLMLADGFVFIHAMMVKERIVEFSVSYRGLSADVFFYIPVQKQNKVGICGVYFDPTFKYDAPNLNNYRVWFFPNDIKTKEITFKGIKICVPTSPEDVLEFEYGKGWRFPVKDWVADDLSSHYQVMGDYAVRTTFLNEVLK